MQTGLVRNKNLSWVPLWGESCNPSGLNRVCTGCSCGCFSSIPVVTWKKPNAELTLLISHGNGQDLDFLVNTVAPRFRDLPTPINIVCYEYPGYSLSPLPTSESLCLMAAEAAYRYVRHDMGVPPEKIVAYGISLGTGTAVHVAANFEVGGLILQSPYASLASVKLGMKVAKWLSCMDLFLSYRNAPKVNVPVLLFHGSKDKVVPTQGSIDLATLFPRMYKEPIIVDGAGHNDVIDTLHARSSYLPMLDNYFREVLGKPASASAWVMRQASYAKSLISPLLRPSQEKMRA
jgi:pimeloyl-ACP methyl ester carboxylesterase